jgi:outer membrane receptor protein involved in Fe transport
VTTTYNHQDGDFLALSGDSRSGEDSFWLVDAAISYRLPKRYGIITAGVRNLFDEEFNYFDRDPDNPSIMPDRIFFVTATFAIP